MFFPSAFSPRRIIFISRIYFEKTPELHNLWNFSKSDLSSGAHMGNQMLPCIRGAPVWKMRAGASQQFEMTPLAGPRKRHPGRKHHPPERNGLSKRNSLTWGADGVSAAMLGGKKSSLQDSFSCTGPLIPPFHEGKLSASSGGGLLLHRSLCSVHLQLPSNAGDNFRHETTTARRHNSSDIPGFENLIWEPNKTVLMCFCSSYNHYCD